MGFPEIEPFVEQLYGNAIAFADIFHGVKPQEVLAEDLQDKEQTISGVRDYDIRKNGVCVTAAFAAYTENT
jgi:hypothetical protein